MIVLTELRQKQPRLADPGYLAWVRNLGCCCGCGSPPKSDAHHVRPGSLAHGKPFTGRMRPDDKWALPLRHDHHMALHDYDETAWWEAHGINPFNLAVQFHARYLAEVFPQGRGEPAGAVRPKRRGKPKIVTKRSPRPPGARLKAKIPGRSSFAKGRKLPKGRKFRK